MPRNGYALWRMMGALLSHPAKPIDLKGAALALLISCLWGGNPVAIKLGLLDTPPLRLAAYRFVLGGVAIALWAWATGRTGGLGLARRELRPLGGLGLLFVLQVVTLNVGTHLTSAAHSAILLNLYGVHTVVLAHFLIPGDRLSARKLAGVLIAYGGIVLLFGRQLARAGRAHRVQGAGRPAPRPGEAPPVPDGGRPRRVHRPLVALRARRHALDAAPRLRRRPPGPADRGLQLRREPPAPPALPAERARG